MSATQRKNAVVDAISRGRAAFRSGVKREENPYKKPSGSPKYRTGAWSLFPAWDVGWQQEEFESGTTITDQERTP